MAFCKYCGTKIEDGQICSCAAAQAAAQGEKTAMESGKTAEKIEEGKSEAVVRSADTTTEKVEESGEDKAAKTITIAVPNVDKELVVGTFGQILNVLKAPAVGGAAFVNGNNRNVALILAAVQALFSGILTCVYVGKINSALKAVSNLLFDMTKYKFSGIQGFFVSLLFSVLFSALFAGIFFAAAKILKLDFSLNQAIELAGIRSVYIIIATVLSAIFAFVNIKFSLLIFFAVSVFVMAIIQGVLGAKYSDRQNAVVYTTMLCIFLFIAIVLLIMSKGYTLYIPGSIRNNAGSIGGLLEKFL